MACGNRWKPGERTRPLTSLKSEYILKVVMQTVNEDGTGGADVGGGGTELVAAAEEEVPEVDAPCPVAFV